MDFSMGIFEKLISENTGKYGTMSATKQIVSTLENGTNNFPSVHDLIKDSARLLHVLEKTSLERRIDMLSQDDAESVCTELDYDTDADASMSECEDVATTEVSQTVEPSFKSFVYHVMIKREGKFFCSECIFQTIHYNTFYSHCKRKHSTLSKPLRKRLVNGKKREIPDVEHFYACEGCPFASFSLRGFKKHCSSKHARVGHENILQTISLTDANAELRFRTFISSLNDGQQRRHALLQLRYHFLEKDPKHQCKDTEEVVSCMKCKFSTNFPNTLEEHYSSVHHTAGPTRDPSDHLFHCKKCSFSNVSYKTLHRHFSLVHMSEHITTQSVNHSETNGNNNIMENRLTSDKGENGGMLVDLPRLHTDSVTDEDTSKGTMLQKTMKCDRCAFNTNGICDILNHWRAQHNRFYPQFVMDYINKDFNKNVVPINLPVWMVDAAWMNGWMNRDCTNLIKSPIYLCDMCDFRSTVLNTVNNHHATRHANSSCSLSRLEVVESASSAKKYTHMLCKQTTVFQCNVCKVYYSCFIKNMFVHYKTKHGDIFLGLTNEALELRIRSSTALRCVKCVSFIAQPMEMLQHYEKDHFDSLSTFSVTNSNYSKNYKCELCAFTCDNLNHLVRHLENHCRQHLSDYNTQVVSAYSCSKCRRVFRGIRFMRHHYTRLHVEWTETSFSYKDFPKKFFSSHEMSIPTKTNSKYPSSNKSKVTVYAVDRFVASPKHNTMISPSKHMFANSSQLDSPIQHSFRDLESTLAKVNDKNLATGSSAIRSDKDSSISLLGEDYICPHCTFTSCSPFTLRLHIKQTHQYVFSMEKIEGLRAISNSNHVVPKLVKTCSHHNSMNKSPTVYQKHTKFHHNIKRPYKCSYCSKHYLCDVILRMHIRKKHRYQALGSFKTTMTGGTGYKLFTSCTHNNILLRNPKTHQEHAVARHSKDFPFHCPQCSKAYICGSIFTLHLKKLHQLIATDEFLDSCKRKLNKDSGILVNCLPSKSKPSKPMMEKTGKDYLHAKSVHMKSGNWKCIYCKQMMFSYQILKKHVAKSHPSSKLLKCRWCDYICKTNVQLANHRKIHNRFVASRMSELRDLHKDQRENGVTLSSSDTETPQCASEQNRDFLETESLMVAEQYSDAIMEVFPEKRKRQYARKTIGSSSKEARGKLKVPEANLFKDLSQYYKQTHYGTMNCKLCGFTTTDRTRILIHMKGSHVLSRTFKCKLCFFESVSYQDIESHLVSHHKMERNHHLAIDAVIEYGGNINNETTNGRSGRFRRRGFEPQPSLPRVEIDESSSDNSSTHLRDIFDPFKKVKMITPSNNSSNTQTQQPAKLRTTRSNSSDKFECKYCDAEFPSTYDLEKHMKRHEVALFNSVNLDEDSILFSAISSFLPPLPSSL